MRTENFEENGVVLEGVDEIIFGLGDVLNNGGGRGCMRVVMGRVKAA